MSAARPRRRGPTTVLRAFRARDDFGVTLGLTFAILLVAPFEIHAFRPVLVALLGILLLFTLWTSNAPTRVLVGVAGVGVVGFALVLTNTVRADDAVSRIGFTSVSMVLLLATMGVVVRRITAHLRITARTLAGALALYVLAGLLFAYLDVFQAEVRGVVFFAQPGSHSPVEFLYYSFATLTTVGYGDLSAVDDVGRMISVVEALLGQLYLVTVVGVVVANVGSVRRSRSGRDDHDDSSVHRPPV